MVDRAFDRPVVQWTTGIGKATFPWPSGNDWLARVVDLHDRECLKEWFKSIDDGKHVPYDGQKPTHLLRLIRNIFEHFDEGIDSTSYNRRSAGALGLFAAPVEYVDPDTGDVDKAKFQQAVADWFCCTYPELIDLLWDGLVDDPNLGF